MVWLKPFAFRLLAPGTGWAAPLAVVLLMGATQIIRVWTDTFSTLLQSMSKLKPFWLCVPIQALLSAGLQWRLAPFMDSPAWS